MSNCLLTNEFPSGFWKCCFHSFYRSCCFVAFSLALAVLFFLLTSFIVCHAILDCLFSSEFLNVRTLNRIGQLQKLTASAIEHKIDIICIQKHRYAHSEDIKLPDTGNRSTLATASAWENSINATIGGVGMLIGPQALKTLNVIGKIHPRMMAATFNGKPWASIISCYSPTNISKETELIAFFDELSSLVRCIPKDNVLVIGRDMNTKIEENGNHKYSLHNLSNRNGQNLRDFTIENSLICLNTKLWTYTYANNIKAQIDYVFTKLKINGKIAQWIARLTPLSWMCPPITELSRQKYD